MISNDDLYSITERTFDLSLEDTLGDDVSATAVDSAAASKGKFDSILEDHQLGDSLDGYDGLSGAGKDNGVNQKLHKSIDILMRLSGNPIEMKGEDEDLMHLVEMVHKLSEASDYKLKFLSKNYSFLEGLYDTTRRENELLKMELGKSEAVNKRLHRDLKQQQLQLQQFQQGHLVHQQQQQQQQQQSPRGNEQELLAALETIEQQKRELKDYKRFIKEMMER